MCTVSVSRSMKPEKIFLWLSLYSCMRCFGTIFARILVIILNFSFSFDKIIFNFLPTFRKLFVPFKELRLVRLYDHIIIWVIAMVDCQFNKDNQNCYITSQQFPQQPRLRSKLNEIERRKEERVFRKNHGLLHPNLVLCVFMVRDVHSRYLIATPRGYISSRNNLFD